MKNEGAGSTGSPQANAPAPNPFAASGLFMRTADVWTPFKVSFEGFAGSGKSWTMYLIAIGIYEAEEKTRSICLIDTEKSAKFAVPVFRDHGLIEGQNLFISQSRSLVDFNKILKLANDTRAILLIDSVTHLYEEMCRAFSERKGRPVTYPQDAMTLKPMWKEQFTNPFVNASNCHIIFTGRAAWEYKMSINEDTNKKEFNAEGVKMRGDNETAFEPDLLVLMEREQEIDKEGNVIPYRLATVMKFRNPILDGKQFKNPTWKDFEPAYRFVASGVQAASDNQPADSSMGPLFQKGNAEAFFLQRRRAEQLVEEIEGVYNQWMPGVGGMEKQIRSILYKLIFNSRSKSALAEMHPDELTDGLEIIEHLARYVAKNYDALEKMYKSGQYENINEFFAQEQSAYVDSKKKAQAAELGLDDDVPDFSSNGNEAAKADPEPIDETAKEAEVQGVINAIMEAQTPAHADQIFADRGASIAVMDDVDRRRCDRARNVRKKQLRNGGAGAAA